MNGNKPFDSVVNNYASCMYGLQSTFKNHVASYTNSLSTAEIRPTDDLSSSVATIVAFIWCK